MSTSGEGDGGGEGGGSGGAGSGGIFVPKEELITVLIGLGVTRNAAIKALFHTGNYNADLAAAWIFENQDQDLDAPLAASDLGDSSDSEGGMEDFLDEGDFYKMVFIVNMELNMGMGKIAAQVAHAALGLYKHIVEEQQRYGEMLLQWEQFGETKIVLKGKNVAHIEDLLAKANSLGVPNFIVQDAGKTQIPSGAVTVLGVMGKADIVNQVTGQLNLL